MTDSLRALLSGAIDYAGMFPPASLSLTEALANWRDYRSGPHAWMLGRFVCPTSKLNELANVFSPQDDGPISLITPANATNAEFRQGLAQMQAALNAFPAVASIEMIEIQCIVDEVDANSYTFQYILQNVTFAIDPLPPTIYLELPPSDAPSIRDRWKEVFTAQLEAVARCSAGPVPVGLKLRMGPNRYLAPPPSSQIALVICGCRDAREEKNEAGVFWKATAGLHHALAHFDPQSGRREHGFLNLFVAAILSDVQGLNDAAVEEILDDDDPTHFRFSSDGLSWRGEFTANVDQITAARQRSLRSFGSCSFEEPLADLRSLGLL